MDSILNSIKIMLGDSVENTHFDYEIMAHINTEFSKLWSLGIGPTECFSITSAENKWPEFMQNKRYMESARTLVYIRVKLIFDPPQNSFIIDSLKKSADEIEWRLFDQSENERIKNQQEVLSNE